MSAFIVELNFDSFFIFFSFTLSFSLIIRHTQFFYCIRIWPMAFQNGFPRTNGDVHNGYMAINLPYIYKKNRRLTCAPIFRTQLTNENCKMWKKSHHCNIVHVPAGYVASWRHLYYTQMKIYLKILSRFNTKCRRFYILYLECNQIFSHNFRWKLNRKKNI